jgi:hypothetical protein
MGGLRSALEELVHDEPSGRTYDELRTDVVEISAAIGVLTQQLAARTHQVAVRGDFGIEGFLNITSWLAAVTDTDHGSARRVVSLGNTLNEHHELARRLASGDLSCSRVRILARAATGHPDQYRQHEEMLLGFADELSLKDLRRAVDYWSNCHDDTRGEQTAQRQRDSVYLHASPALGGMVRIDGLFDRELGEDVLTALDAAMTPRARDSADERPAPLRRAEALGHICRQFLNNHPGVIGGHRPHVSLIVDVDTLNGRVGRRCELGHVGTITPDTARRILCDAEVSWMIVNTESVPLAMGRSVRTATPAQLRALAVRDGGCTWPGCDRPPAWCDAHHDPASTDNGYTDVDKMRLLCRPNHTRTHTNNHTENDTVRRQ